jgi:5-methyltetrahydrofolate--homocysteine methyltransferase
MNRPDLIDVARQRVLVFDGAMGTAIHRCELPLSDYNGLENCSEILVLTRPDVIQAIHQSFLAIGCDAVSTDTFGGSKLTLGEFGLAERTYEINRRAAEIAREVCTRFTKPSRPRFVLGSIGPGSKLPSLGQTDWDQLLDSFTDQCRGLLDGGVDALLIETCQDILQAKAAVVSAMDAMTEKRRCVPLLCTVTIELNGTMLVGTDIAAACVVLEAYDQLAGIGLNCATGPQEMSEHVRHLSAHCDRLLIVQPNAGLPELVDGRPRYRLTPKELAKWVLEFVDVHGVNMVGGCCGTTPEHLAAVVDAVADQPPRSRRVHSEPSVSSLYQAVTIRQDSSVLAIGERTNANGSKRFRELLSNGDIEGMVRMAREQVRDGSHLLDVCTAYAGRDEAADLAAVVKRFVTDVTAPLVIDSTEPAAIEAALKLAGGRCIINSINLEAGEERAGHVCDLARRYGAAVIALTIDEAGMAKTCDRKVDIAKRLFELATHRYGLRPSDLIFDPLTFTICTGSEADRRLAVETLDAIERIKKVCPGVHTSLGISNVSFGLKVPIRRVLNSVFLHHARERGLDAAILHAGGILPLFKIDELHRRLAEDLVFDRRHDGYDPLHALLQAFEETGEPETAEAGRHEPVGVEQRLKACIIDGDATPIETDLEEAMLTRPALEIINEVLLDGMRTVGDLFAAGQMQLPFVLRSAETMKAAVTYLEPYLDKRDGAGKGTLVLATVRGDVHDIGKNLVDIILSNNGYTVHNLGIKQPIGNVIDACREHGADAIGLSGLLVKSTLVMRDDLAVLNERGIDIPVILGGAALTRRYVEQELRPRYPGPLHYAKDAFAGLHLMDAIMCGETRSQRAIDVRARAAAQGRTGGDEEAPAVVSPTDVHASASARHGYAPPQSDISREEPVPEPPFWGSRVVNDIPPENVLDFLNENMLFQVQWGYHRAGRSREEYQAYLDAEVRPTLRQLVDRCCREDILHFDAIYGFWPVQSDGDTLIVYDPDDRDRTKERFEFPRQGRPPYWCLSDFFRPVDGGVYDVAAFMVVTVGRRFSEVERQWFQNDLYHDYLHLHGLGVELAEALAEYLHKRIRTEWGIAAGDAADVQAIFKQHYQGSRYSFGYPACPRLEDQVKLWPLLRPDRIDVSLSETFQLEPEQTTTALIAHHRQARYFNVR